MAVTTAIGAYYRLAIIDPTGNSPGFAHSLAIKGKPGNTTSRYTAVTVYPSNSILAHKNQNGDYFEFNGPSFGNSPCLYSGATIDQGAGQSGSSWVDTTSHYTTAWNVGSAAFTGSGTNQAHGYTNGVLCLGTSQARIGAGLLTDQICIGASIPADNSGNDVPQQTFIGSLATLGFWIGATLTDREQTAYAVGASPRLIHRGNLYSYVPLVDGCFNACYRSTLRTTGAPTLLRHPRQYGW